MNDETDPPSSPTALEGDIPARAVAEAVRESMWSDDEVAQAWVYAIGVHGSFAAALAAHR